MYITLTIGRIHIDARYDITLNGSAGISLINFRTYICKHRPIKIRAWTSNYVRYPKLAFESAIES